MVKRLLTIVVLFTFFFACRRKHDLVIPINSDLRKNFSYKPGTYWIYFDSISGQRDSFTVFARTTTSVSSSSEDYDLEIDNIKVYNDRIPLDSLLCSWQLLKDHIQYFYEATPNIIDYSTFLTLPYPSFGQIYESGTDKYKIITNIYNYNINNMNFNNVIEICHFGIYDNYNDTFFVESTVGIIKMNIHHFKDSSFMSENLNYRWEIRGFNILH